MNLLNPQQQSAVEYDEGHLLIVAGPGTGKTHTITQKIAALVQKNLAQAEQIVALTFTRKAGETLTTRLKKLLYSRLPGSPSPRLPFAGTFHSFCLQILRAHDVSHAQPSLRILSQKEQEEIFASVGKDKNLYHQQLTAMNALDFDGILTKTLELLQTDAQLKNRIHQTVTHLFVDEYQDVDETQYRLIKELTGPKTKLCAIGDPDQAIYSFRGANPEHFLQFEKDFPGTKIIHLEENYRSTPNVVECANALIVNNVKRVHKNLRSAAKPAPGVAEQGPRIAKVPCQTPLSEAIYIAKEIAKLVGGTDTTSMDQKAGSEYETHYHFSDIAVIYRTNMQGKLLETALKKEGLPYQRFAAALWFEEKEVEALLAHVSCTLDPQNLPDPQKGFRKQYEELHQAAHAQTPAETLKNILKNFHLEEQWNDGTPKGEKRWNNILRLLNFAVQFERPGAENGEVNALHPLKTFHDELKLLNEHDAYDERMQAVTLMSIHASKGLEFPVVFIAGVEEGTLPYLSKKPKTEATGRGRAQSASERGLGLVAPKPTAIEEERRLMYVGLTRAKERIFITYAKTRQEKPMQPSTFLQEIAPHLVEIQPEKRNNRTLWKKKQLSIF